MNQRLVFLFEKSATKTSPERQRVTRAEANGKRIPTMKRSNKVSERLMSHYSTLILFIAGHPLVFSLLIRLFDA